jgi:hypothetical protein
MDDKWTDDEIKEMKEDHERSGSPPFQFNRIGPLFNDEDTVDELPAPPRKEIPAADRELLELAARALGAVRTEEVDGEGYLNLYFEDGTVVYAWNPLLHSDDAFNLAADLELDIMHRVVGGRRVEVLAAGGQLIQELYEDDRKAATRLAVTRAAAKIGKAMQ